MKKTFTLLATAVLFAPMLFAQDNHSRNENYGSSRDRDLTVNSNRDGNGYGKERGTYYFSAREKDMQISSINNDYNRKIESVKHKFFMGRYKKEQIIYSLNLQRDSEIRSVFAKFIDRKNLFNRRDNGYRDRDNNRHDDQDRKNF